MRALSMGSCVSRPAEQRKRRFASTDTILNVKGPWGRRTITHPKQAHSSGCSGEPHTQADRYWKEGPPEAALPFPSVGTRFPLSDASHDPPHSHLPDHDHERPRPAAPSPISIASPEFPSRCRRSTERAYPVPIRLVGLNPYRFLSQRNRAMAMVEFFSARWASDALGA